MSTKNVTTGAEQSKQTSGRPRIGTVKRLDNGKWKIGIRAPGGKRVFETKPADWSPKLARDYAEAESTKAAVLARQNRALAAVVAKGTAGETLAQYAERWLADRENRGLSSNRQDRSRLLTHLLPALGPRAMTEITKRDLEVLVQWLDEQIHGGTMSWRSARLLWGLTSKLFDDACNAKNLGLRVLHQNPAAGVRPPDKGVCKTKAFLYPSELLSLVSCEAVPLRWRRIYALAVYTYTRPGELEALEWADVDLDRGTAHVHRAMDREHGGTKPTKTKKARRIPVEPTLLPLLQAMHAEVDGKGRVAVLPTVEYLSGALREHLSRAGVTRPELTAQSETQKRITFYDLRATGITWRACRGDAPLAIQQDAGHENFETTQGYVRSARVLASNFGVPFPALPKALLGDAVGSWLDPGLLKLAGPLRSQRESNPGSGEHCAQERTVAAPITATPERPSDNKCAMSRDGSNVDPTVAALAVALERASAAGQWDVVSQLAGELQARRLAAAGVPSLPDRKRSL